MRHNQNNRRFRGGRSNNGGGQNTTHHQGGGNHHQGGGQQHQGGGYRRVNRGTQTFDSNGPEVRIRGNAYQINEKYATLAKDAASAGDRILAESYLQHAEHYQRMINEIAEENARHQPQMQQQHPQDGGQPIVGDETPADAVVTSIAQPGAEQPSVGLEDLDQGFLRTPARPVAPQQPVAAEGGEEQPQRQPRAPRQRQTEQV